MASRSPLVQALLSLPGSLHTGGARQSFVQSAAPNPPGMMRFGESPKPHSESQSFTGATTAQPFNVVHPEMPATFQAPEPAASSIVRALMPSTPAAPVPSAPAALVAAVGSERPVAPAAPATAPTGVGAPGGATLAPNPPVPTVAPVFTLPGAQPVADINFASPARQQSTATGEVYEGHLPTPQPSGITSNLIAQYAQLGKRLNPSVGSSRTSYGV